MAFTVLYSGPPLKLDEDPDYKRWNDARMRRKKPLPAMAYGVLSAWVASNGTKDELLNMATFRYIVAHLKNPTAPVTDRLFVALGDVGYTPDELKGKTALEIAKEIVARGKDDNPDDSDDDDA